MTLPSRLRALAFYLTLLLSLRAVMARAEPAPLLPDGAWTLSAPHPGDAAQSEVPLTDGDPPLRRVIITHPSDPFYQIQISRPLAATPPAGHRLRLIFWARSATKNSVRVTVERDGPPYEAALERTVTLTPDWKTYTTEGRAPGYSLSVHFQMGQQAGAVDLMQITMDDLGDDPALAAARAALQPAAVQARIAKYRQGTLTVRVVNAQGKPVRGASVHLAQARHAFLFGSNFFGLDPADRSPAQTAYQREFTGVFNYATLPFYWGAFEPVRGRTDDDRLRHLAAWSVAHGVEVKGHPLVWHEVWPVWAPTDPEAAIPLLHARVAALIPRYQDAVHIWDVLNEANAAAGHTPPNGEGNWIKRDGPAPVVETALGWARDAARGLPKAARPETFLYNDYDTGEANVALLTQLQHDDKLPDAVGLQSHMHGGEWPMAKVWSVCQTFARFGRPLHFTEVTVLSGPRRANPTNATLTGWNTTPEGEAAQAAYVAQFYAVLFSHPSVRAITWWDFSDRNAWQGAPAGLVRKDMSPKPAYTRLMDLIHHRWWTNESGKTDTRGTITRRVFYGDYTITATEAPGRTATRTLTFPESGLPRTVTIRVAGKGSE